MARRVAFVTGASRGIGKASALALAEVGYDVVVTARTVVEGERRDYSAHTGQPRVQSLPGSIQKTAAEIRERGHRALAIRLDLLDRASIDAAITKTLEEWGQIDLLLNNGIYQGPGLMDRFLDVPEETTRRIFEGNFFAQVHLTRRVLAPMLERGAGTIINMTSNAGRNDPPGPTGDGGWGFFYAASKGAFHRMAGILHVELNPRGICAYNVDPGYVTTEAMRATLGENTDLDRHFRSAPPEVPAAVIAWLASNAEAPSLSGQTLNAVPFYKKRGLGEIGSDFNST